MGLDGVHYKRAIPYAWADASLGNSGRCELRKSFGGCVIVMDGAVIHSRSGLQKVTADSSAKAETIEIYYTTRELVYIRQLFENLGMPLKEPTTLYEDNSSAISIMEMTSNGSQSRHFELKLFWTHSIIDAGSIKLVKCKTEHQLADPMTKALPSRQYRKLEYWIQGLHNLPAEEVAKLGYDSVVDSV